MKNENKTNAEAKKNLNEGYQAGFAGESPTLQNEDYMSGYRIGCSDRAERLGHLKGASRS